MNETREQDALDRAFMLYTAAAQEWRSATGLRKARCKVVMDHRLREYDSLRVRLKNRNSTVEF